VKEWPWIFETVVVVALGGEVHHYIGLTDELIYKITIADIAVYECDAIERQVVGVAGVGECINYGYFVLGSFL
jgi:hypothetical protein